MLTRVLANVLLVTDFHKKMAIGPIFLITVYIKDPAVAMFLIFLSFMWNVLIMKMNFFFDIGTHHSGFFY